MQQVDMIAAVSNNMAIGLMDGKLPWHIPEELAWFSGITANRAIIMGRKTWDSLPVKPLPHRQNIVLTTRRIRGVDCVSSIEEALTIARNQPIVIGGADIYRQAMPFVSKLYLSIIPMWVDVPHVKFPINERRWHMVNRVDHPTYSVLTMHPLHPALRFRHNPITELY
jgi:dihydrofolate reductase